MSDLSRYLKVEFYRAFTSKNFALTITPGYALCILSAMIGIFTCAAFVAIHKKNLSVAHTLA